MTSRFDPNRNTIQAKFGFLDEDLKSSKHDEIMLWVDANIERLLFPFMKNEYWEKVLRAQANRTITFELPPLPNKANPKIMHKIWEYPVMNGNYTVGFIDILIKYGEPFPVLHNIKMNRDGDIITKENENTPYWQIQWCSNEPSRLGDNYEAMEFIGLEIKSELSTIGELVRQIRMYQTYLNVPFFVVSPDDRFASALQSQNIGFIKYEP